MGKDKNKDKAQDVESEEKEAKPKKPSVAKGITSMIIAAISYIAVPYYLTKYIAENYPSFSLPAGMTNNITGTGVFLVIAAFLMGYTVPETRFHGLAGIIQVSLTGYYTLKVLGNSVVSATYSGTTLVIDFSNFTYILVASILLNALYYLGELMGDKD